MSKDEFLALRTPPSGRSGVFDVEALLMKELKAPQDKKVTTTKWNPATFDDAVKKLTGGAIGSERLDELRELTRQIIHVEDLDYDILAVASFLRLQYPNGLSITQPKAPGTMSPQDFQSSEIASLVETVMGGKGSKKESDVAGIKADILAYYKMFFL